jgi:hypothetical protein
LSRWTLVYIRELVALNNMLKLKCLKIMVFKANEKVYNLLLPMRKFLIYIHSMPPTFARHVQKVVCYLSGIMIIQFIVVENNGGQKVCITAWQFSAFNRSP